MSRASLIRCGPMNVLDTHEHELRAPVPKVGAPMDSLVLPDDRLWPRAVGPRMRFDRQLAPARLTWPPVFRPLHDALIRDALTQTELSLGLQHPLRPWSLRVRCLRWLVSRGKARPQRVLLAGSLGR